MLYIWISLGISIAGVFASIGVSAFMSGMRWGVVQADIRYLRRDLDKLLEHFRLTPAIQEERRRR